MGHKVAEQHVFCRPHDQDSRYGTAFPDGATPATSSQGEIGGIDGAGVRWSLAGSMWQREDNRSGSDDTFALASSLIEPAPVPSVLGKQKRDSTQ